MTVTQLMADLLRLGIRLEARGNQLRFWPRSTVTLDLAKRMKAHKCDLLTILRPEGVLAADANCADDPKTDYASVKAQCIRCARCGSVESCDIPIHGGQSVRRDCVRCGRFIDFPKWYGTC